MSKENNTTPIIEKSNKINYKKLKKIKEQTFFLNFKNWIGQNIIIASQYFYLNQIDYRIVKLLPPDNFENNSGIIKNIYKDKNNIWQIEVYYQAKENKLYSEFEKANITLEEKGSCYVTMDSLDDTIAQKVGKQIIFSTINKKEVDNINLLFYRQGPVKIEAFCNNNRVYKKKFYPENLS